MKTNFLPFFMLLITIYYMPGCGSDTETMDKYLGTWQNVQNSRDIIEISKDGDLFVVRSWKNSVSHIAKFSNGSLKFDNPSLGECNLSNDRTKLYFAGIEWRKFDLAKQDKIISDGMNIAAYAQSHYRKSATMGGGGGSFYGFEIPSSLIETTEGKYTIRSLASQSLLIVGTGKELKIKVIIKVTPGYANVESVK